MKFPQKLILCLTFVHGVVDKDVFFARQPEVYTAPRTLVISEVTVSDLKKTYGKFIDSLERRGHQLTFADIGQKATYLFQYGEKIFENVVLIPRTKNFPSAAEKNKGFIPTGEIIQENLSRLMPKNNPLSVSQMLAFIDAGGNVVFMSGTPGREMRKFANECGIDFHKESSRVIDYFNVHPDDDGEGKMIFGRPRREQPIVSQDKNVLFKGISQHVASSPLTFPILGGHESAFAVETAEDGLGDAIAAGGNVALVSAMQARNSARAVFVGSDLLCSDEYFELNSANQEFCDDISKWAFREKGILRMSNLRSHKVGETHQPYMYRIQDDITFMIDIQEYSEGQWKPYVANDVQLEFVMLDPHERMFLEAPEKGSATYKKTFKSPDVYGVFKFKIQYSRVGYNTLHVEDLAPLRNFKHNDYERFIWCAYPYYASCLLVPVMVIVFSTMFLYHKEDPKSGIILTSFNQH